MSISVSELKYCTCLYHTLSIVATKFYHLWHHIAYKHHRKSSQAFSWWSYWACEKYMSNMSSDIKANSSNVWILWEYSRQAERNITKWKWDTYEKWKIQFYWPHIYWNILLRRCWLVRSWNPSQLKLLYSDISLRKQKNCG